MKRSWVKVNSPPPHSLSRSLSRPISLIFRCWFISSRGHWAMQQICTLIPFMSPPLIYNLEVFHIEAANHLYHNSQPKDTMSRMKQLEETPQAFQGRAHRLRGIISPLRLWKLGVNSCDCWYFRSLSTTPTCSMSITRMKQKLTNVDMALITPPPPDFFFFFWPVFFWELN